MSSNAENLVTLFWKSVSILFHPIFNNLIIFTILFFGAKFLLHPLGEVAQWALFSLIVGATTFIPLFILVIYHLLNHSFTSIQYLEMHNKEERILPFFYVSIYYMGLIYLFKQHLNLPELILQLLYIYTIGFIFISLISLVIKISAHALFMGITVAIIYIFNVIWPLPLMKIFLLCALLLSGLVLTARLALQAHSNFQIYLGFFTGLMIPLLLFIYIFN
jgi:hypothetical protein